MAASNRRTSSVLTAAALLLGDAAKPFVAGEMKFRYETLVTSTGTSFPTTRCGNKAESKGPVLLLHGFPFFMDSWEPLMTDLCEDGWHAVAFNQRGYTPDSPTNVDRYKYNLLREDVFEVADALKWEKFNLVSHDHGAVLGYYVVDSEAGKERVLTFSALSIPHPNVFSDALYGDHIDPDQELASQYFQMWSTPDSAKAGNNFMYNAIGASFESPEALQLAMYWYNGAFEEGVVARPRLYSVEETKQKTNSSQMREAFSHVPAKPGSPQTVRVGDVTMPFLYAIGTGDTWVRGWDDWALATRTYAASRYTEIMIDAGHQIMTPAADNLQFQILFDGIKGHLMEAEEPIDDENTTTNTPVTRTPPPLEARPPLLRDSVFWIVIFVSVFAAVVGAYVAFTGNEESENDIEVPLSS